MNARSPLAGCLRAGRVFPVIVTLVVTIFCIAFVWLADDQQRVLGTTERLRSSTLPKIAEYQRLARNLEQLRLEGERVFSVDSAEGRRQALFVVTLIASHPSVLDHPRSAGLARDAEKLLTVAVADGARLPALRSEWQQLSDRLTLQVDEVSAEAIDLAATDLGNASALMRNASLKLTLGLALGVLILAVSLGLLLRHLIRPLQRIDRALSELGVDRPPPSFPPSLMLEIRMIENAIGGLHELLLKNESARRELEVLASRDGLTGLFNRRHFMRLAESELLRASRYGRPVTVGMADLDNFKVLNDTHGHAAGDAVLQAFALMLQADTRQSDLICRYGGEEFAFVFPESTLEEAANLVERFRAHFAERPIELPDGTSVGVSVSIGLAEVGDGALETALERADAALYEAKRSGRNRIVSDPAGAGR